MALTRPKFYQVDTSITAFSDPITVLHNGSTQANVDVGLLFNRSNGLTSNVAFYWNEASQSIVTAHTTDSGVPNANINASSYANFHVGTLIAESLNFANGTPIATSINPGLYMGTTTVVASPTLVDTIPVTGNSLVRWTTTSKDNVNDRYRVSTLDTLNDGSNVYFTEYGVIKSNASFDVATFTSNISSGNINLWSTGDSSNVTVAFERVVLGSGTKTGYLNAGTPGATGPTGATGSIADTSSWIRTTNTTPSTSTTTGALQVAGGAGISGALYAGSIFSAGGLLSTGISVFNGNIVANSGISSISTTTGAVVVNGGVGVTGNVYAGKVYTGGLYWSGNGNVIQTGGGGGGAGLTYTASSTAPTLPNPGDIWYNTTSNVQYTYTDDGVSTFWLDTSSVETYSTEVGATIVTGNLIPASNVTYDIGTESLQYRSLYLSGNTISLGGATIKVDAGTGAFFMVPNPTTSNPNPKATVISSSGTITTVETVNGNVANGSISSAANASSSVFGNITVNNQATVGNLITTSGVYWSNGAPYSSGSGGGAVSIGYDNSNVGNLYPLFANVTSGAATNLFTSNTKYFYRPSTGEVQAPAMVATNGVFVNNNTMTANYTVAAGQNGFSVGPITQSAGVVVTVTPGSRWVII